MPNPLPPRIDVHSHFLPPFYHDALIQTGHSNPDGMPAIPPWSAEAHLDMMDSANVKKSILSISSPGTHLTPGDGAARKQLTRQCNAYAASLKKQHPEKFGFWASLPLPDVEATLEEIEKAIAEGCDGFGLMTNYHGKYLGDAAFDTVFAKLNALGATVFIHPTTPCIAHGIDNEAEPATVTKALPHGSDIPVPIYEFLFDTSRAVINLFYSGTIDRSPKMKFIIPHVGGSLPPLITRFTTFGGLAPGGKALNGEVVRKQMVEQFYFDMAGTIFDDASSGRGQLKALVSGFDISYQRLLYGSDFPFTNTGLAVKFAEIMSEGLEQLFNEQERDAIYEKNAKKLLEEGSLGAKF